MRGSVADTRCGWTACALPAVQPTTTQHLAMHRFPTSCRPPDALLTGTPEDVIDSPDPIKGDNHTCPIEAKVPTALFARLVVSQLVAGKERSGVN